MYTIYIYKWCELRKNCLVDASPTFLNAIFACHRWEIDDCRAYSSAEAHADWRSRSGPVDPKLAKSTRSGAGRDRERWGNPPNLQRHGPAEQPMSSPTSSPSSSTFWRCTNFASYTVLWKEWMWVRCLISLRWTCRTISLKPFKAYKKRWCQAFVNRISLRRSWSFGFKMIQGQAPRDKCRAMDSTRAALEGYLRPP